MLTVSRNEQPSRLFSSTPNQWSCLSRRCQFLFCSYSNYLILSLPHVWLRLNSTFPSIFVSSINSGFIYHFKLFTNFSNLSSSRNSLSFSRIPLAIHTFFSTKITKRLKKIASVYSSSKQQTYSTSSTSRDFVDFQQPLISVSLNHHFSRSIS